MLNHKQIIKTLKHFDNFVQNTPKLTLSNNNRNNDDHNNNKNDNDNN